MKNFMDENFLLSTETAQLLYHDYAKQMPIVDYHCHINPQEIAEDREFTNLTQLWLEGDHYKWRLMRCNGVEERFITGDASPREKFQKWAETLEKAIGNPLYHWTHLELQRFFGYQGVLNGETAEEIWQTCNDKLLREKTSARKLIKQMNVKVICTTDDPADDLRWHQMLAEDTSFEVKVLPAWRPEKAMNLRKDDFVEYMEKLSQISGVTITTFQDLKEALVKRMDFFGKMGCVLSDHSLDYVMYRPVTEEEASYILEKAMRKEKVSETELMQYQYAFLLFIGKEYAKRGWTMQLHYGVKRNNDERRFRLLGADTGFDCINNYTPTEQLSDFLNALAATKELPKTIIYSLNPGDNAAIQTVIGCFAEGGYKSKIQQGAAWWFNDHKTGIKEQLITLANLGILSNFVGMLTDSRSFLSYTRHEYFRRILCELIGEWVENGEYPADLKRLGKMVEDISYYNAVEYFQFF